MYDGRGNVRAAALAVGLVLVAISFVIYLLSARQFDAGRGDLFWLADAFLKGRTWLDGPLGPNDVVLGPSGEVFVPFAPFPAIAFMPLVAVIGPANADLWEPIINAAIAAADVGMAMWLAGRAGVRSLGDRVWLAVLLGFSTQICFSTRTRETRSISSCSPARWPRFACYQFRYPKHCN